MTSQIRILAAFFLLVGAAAFVPAHAGRDGQQDARFGTFSGYTPLLGTDTHNPSTVPVLVDVLSQADGKVVLVGNRRFAVPGQNGTEYVNAIYVYRLLPNGQWDRDFGNDRITVLPSPYQGSESWYATAAALDPTGRIAIAGYVKDSFFPRQSMAMWVLTPSGQLDTNFGSGGAFVYDRGKDWSRDRANDVFAFSTLDHTRGGLRGDYEFALVGELSDDLSPDNGESNPGPRQGVVVFRDAAGNVPFIFNDGVLLPPITRPGCSENPLVAVAARTGPSAPPGSPSDQTLRIYATGVMYCSDGFRSFLYKLMPSDGAPWVTNHFGTQSVSYFSSVLWPAAVAVDAAGRPVVAGPEYVNGGWNHIGVFRLTRHGAYDTSFNGAGYREIHFTNSPETTPSRVRIAGLLIQHDGKIVIGGDVEQRNMPSMLFSMRMDSLGSGDPSFGEPTTVLSYTEGSFGGPRTYVDGASWYYSPTGVDWLQEDNTSAAGMAFNSGERIVMAGSIPGAGTASAKDYIEVMRLDNDHIFGDSFGWQ